MPRGRINQINTFNRMGYDGDESGAHDLSKPAFIVGSAGAVSAYDVGKKETWALTTRQPSGMRTQVWVWRPRLPDSRR